MNVQVRVLALIVAIGLFLTFILQNTESVTLRFLGIKFSTYLSVHCLISYLLGMLSGWAIFSFVGRALRQVAERRKA